MSTVRRISLLAVLLAAALSMPATAGAFDPLGFRYSSPVYTVHENAGAAVITIERTNTAGAAQIRYIALPGTASRTEDFTPVKARLDFAPGQSSATFTVPIVDHGLPGLPRTVDLGMFGAYPIGIAAPSQAVLTIINDDPVSILRDPLNPLGLPVAPPPGDPLTGARPYIDWTWGTNAVQARAWRHSHPGKARLLNVIARQGEVHRWGNWTPVSEVGIQVSQYLERAADEEPGTVPEFSTYYLVGGCSHKYADSPAQQARYHAWIESLAAGVGYRRAIMFLEEDSLISVGCLTRHGVDVRMQELHDAIDILSKLPRLVVYLDAGAADALQPGRVAALLRQAGVDEIEGFFLNATHFDWTRREVRYGERISRLTGGKHFIVNTAANGRGPLVPANRSHRGNEVLCNPPGRGLGPLPTFNTGFPNVDAFAWIMIPGKSGGRCRPGAPATGVYWPELALELVRNRDFRVR